MEYNELDEARHQLLSAQEAAHDLADDVHDLDEEAFDVLANRIGLYDDVPEADDMSLGIHMPTAELTQKGGQYHAAYRGWYGNRWCPRQSMYGGPRGGGRTHKGADIAVPMGTPLVALVGPAQIQWNPRGNGGKWGNHIFLNFKWKDGANYTFVYAHLHSLVGSNPRRVKVGEEICTAGCTGNAGGPGMYCGVPNRCGGRSDHLHLELFGPNGRIDPIGWLGLNMKYANDNRCGECVPRTSG